MTRKLLGLMSICVLLLGAAVVVGHGSRDVTTAGTAERLVNYDLIVAIVTIQAKQDNTASMFVGGEGTADGAGIELVPGDSWTPPPLGYRNAFNLRNFYVNSVVSGEGVTFIYCIR